MPLEKNRAILLVLQVDGFRWVCTPFFQKARSRWANSFFFVRGFVVVPPSQILENFAKEAAIIFRLMVRASKNNRFVDVDKNLKRKSVSHRWQRNLVIKRQRREILCSQSMHLPQKLCTKNGFIGTKQASRNHAMLQNGHYRSITGGWGGWVGRKDCPIKP